MNNKTIWITGASSGIGKALAIKFAQEGVFTFSTKPLKIAITLGLLTITFGFLGLLYILYIKFFTSQSVPGITTIIFAISMFGGVQLFITGILGAYLGYIFEQVKGRPLYVIKDLYNINDLFCALYLNFTVKVF